ncbi:30S ribosomal protein S11 [candidate division WWE3 bacterium RIFOXYC2_FULL_42_13]|uniref:Small ribosomal subunit protein uS11 n=2 Tax=Katanobacteria TaxID=422282 RepID=A0A0G1EQV7_UNCKA|nr:MAG: Ribosomal protein S11 [candidate division WWE3 bacterium GW2011_GWB2_43_22]OGC58490.1 MAG: 30S ribosomal protein S11 [candidate division WWE3 bacterium RIFOXYA2_FULL_43_12]OGC66883.1 MAG: 30S ribosomal protein S11 [candidate division WWE3 bacterium RIFOXYA12_FULL_43_11]OGC71992.1 MAG: 30S ribosomal protein S11 [candidate division WWE3 bacterium RIFOXYB2_FULL_43_9]OGC73397.1 MAG: 30S ribosomal protein S11 [candidate division WWE3 bacterium RIFOXYC2_FULL_42_13]OGC75676.1 MAG: 30S ribosom
MAQKTTKGKKKEKIITPSGRVYITAGMNNTIITVTDSEGNTLFTASSGSAGFKGSRKSTPYASTKAAEIAGNAASKAGVRDVSVYLKGAGLGRISSIKALKTVGLNVVSISDLTPIPHNGCRPEKKRRV